MVEVVLLAVDGVDEADTATDTGNVTLGDRLVAYDDAVVAWCVTFEVSSKATTELVVSID